MLRNGTFQDFNKISRYHTDLLYIIVLYLLYDAPLHFLQWDMQASWLLTIIMKRNRTPQPRELARFPKPERSDSCMTRSLLLPKSIWLQLLLNARRKLCFTAAIVSLRNKTRTQSHKCDFVREWEPPANLSRLQTCTKCGVDISECSRST